MPVRPAVVALLYAVAIIAVTVVFVTRCRTAGLRRYHAFGAAIWGMVGGLLGARLLYLLLRADQVLREPAMILDLSGGTMSWGAYFGGALGAALYFRSARQSPWPYADVLASTFGLGPFIARFACFVNGDDFGRVSEVAWAVTYPPGSLAFDLHVRQGLLASGASASLPVHPVQIYLAAAGLALFVLFSWLWRHRAFRPGALFALYWAADGAARVALEFFRGDVERTYVGPFPDGQVIALGVSVAALAAFVWLHRRPDAMARGVPRPATLEEQRP